MLSSRSPSQPRDQTQVSCILGQILYCLSHQGSPISMMQNVNFESRTVLLTEKAFYKQYDSEFNIVVVWSLSCV